MPSASSVRRSCPWCCWICWPTIWNEARWESAPVKPCDHRRGPRGGLLTSCRSCWRGHEPESVIGDLFCDLSSDFFRDVWRRGWSTQRSLRPSVVAVASPPGSGYQRGESFDRRLRENSICDSAGRVVADARNPLRCALARVWTEEPRSAAGGPWRTGTGV